MITPFSTNALLSFYAWLDHRLLQEGQMYYNQAGQLYLQGTDSVLGSGPQTFAAPFRSLVWDASISGANQFTGISGYVFDASRYTPSGGDQLYTSVIFPQIPATGYGGDPLQFDLSFSAYITVPTGTAVLSGNSVFWPDNVTQTGVVRFSGQLSGDYTDLQVIMTGSPTIILQGQYGMQIDYQNGRIIFPETTVPTYATVSGAYAFKEFNLYFGNQLADRMRFTDKPYLNSRFNRATTGWNPHEMTTPAILISDTRMRSELKGLGGLYDTTVNMQVHVLAENLGQLENALSLIRDAKDLCFPEITPDIWPLAPTGDIKVNPYNYETLFDARETPSGMFSISQVRCFKGGDSVGVDQSIFVGRAEIVLKRDRQLR